MDWQRIQYMRKKGWFTLQRTAVVVISILCLFVMLSGVVKAALYGFIQTRFQNNTSIAQGLSEVALAFSIVAFILCLAFWFKPNRVLRMVEKHVVPDAAAFRAVASFKVIYGGTAAVGVLLAVAIGVIGKTHLSLSDAFYLGDLPLISGLGAFVLWSVCSEIGRLSEVNGKQRLIIEDWQISMRSNRYLSWADIDEMSSSGWFRSVGRWPLVSMIGPSLGLVVSAVIMLAIPQMFRWRDSTTLANAPLLRDPLVIVCIVSAVYCAAVLTFYVNYWMRVKSLFHSIESRLEIDARVFKHVTGLRSVMIFVYVLGSAMGAACFVVVIFAGGDLIAVLLGLLIAFVCVLAAVVGRWCNITATTVSKVFAKPLTAGYPQVQPIGYWPARV
jgi:hypothetical protein